MNETTPATVVLVIEDDAPIRRFLRAGLESQGFQLVEAVTGEDGIAQAAMRTPELVLLDLGLPDVDGVEVVRRLREWSAVPVLVLSARGQESDKIRALDAGADDYVTKPIAMGELLARMRAALRRGARTQDGEAASVVESVTPERLTDTLTTLLPLVSENPGPVKKKFVKPDSASDATFVALARIF